MRTKDRADAVIELASPRRRRRSLIVLVSLAVVAVLVATGVIVWTRTRGSPEGTAASYLTAWQRGDYPAMRSLVVEPPPGFAERHTRMRDDLGVTRVRLEPGAAREQDSATLVDYTATLTLRGVGEWTYQGRLRLVPHERQWRVDWSPAALHPTLRDGERLRRELTWPERAPILAADDSRLDAAGQPGSVQQLVGTLGPATEEDVERLGPPYREDDQVGTAGLQQTYERRLAGRPGATIQVVEEQAGDDAEPLREIAELDGEPGKPVQTAIDPQVQAAASGTLRDSDQTEPMALVAVRPATGEILAVANRPGGFNRALLGGYPPGSTFKVVTAAALVADGVSLDQRVACPATTTIGGRTFHNYRYHDFGNVTFHTAFARSCNTTFGRLAVERLGDERLTEVAGSFGFGAPLTPGVPATRGKFPDPTDSVELAAAAFGQGRVLASPLHMATVAAAIADGTWRPPQLVADAPVGAANEDGATAAAEPAEPRDLEPAIVDALRKLMPAVVSEGTAASVDFPAGVAGKTGTAEYGSAERGEDPPTHAWFIGYQDDVAFAVVVEGGGVGADVAGPIAADFLRRL